MTSKKTTARDPFHTPIPGGVNEDSGITLRGGHATWYEPDKLPPRRSRTMNEAGVRFGGALKRMSEADTSPDGKTLTIGTTKVSEADVALISSLQAADISAMFELNDLSIVTYMKSWTLEQPSYATNPETGETLRDQNGAPVILAWVPAPMPETADACLDLPVETYEALEAAAAVIYGLARKKPDGFSLDAIEDPDSPTGASAD